MADVKVPIKFEIYKGDELVREEVLAQSRDQDREARVFAPASRRRDRVAHARASSRRPARTTSTSSTSGSTRGTTVNGERDHQGAAAVGRRGHVRRLPRDRHLRRAMQPQATPAPQAWGGGQCRPPAATRAPAARRQLRAASPAGSTRRLQPAGVPAAAAPTRRRRSRARRAPAPRSRSTTAPARWRSRPSSAASSPEPATSSTPRARHTHAPGDVDAATPASRPPRWRLGRVRLHGHGRRRGEGAVREAPAAGKDAKTFIWKDRSPASGGIVFGGLLAGLVLSYMGLKRRGKTSPNFLDRLGRRRRRAGLARVHARRRRTRWSRRPAPTTSSTSPRA